jgi:hypothetical protein
MKKTTTEKHENEIEMIPMYRQTPAQLQVNPQQRL